MTVEGTYVNQGYDTNRSIFDSLDLAWDLLRIFPKEQLNRINPKILQEFYSRKASAPADPGSSAPTDNADRPLIDA